MRRFLLALLMTTVVASLQAITINWQVANSEFAWADEGVSTFLVYSQTDGLTAAEVYTAAQGYEVADKNYKTYNGYKVSPGATLGASGSVTSINSPTVDAAELNSYMTFGFGSAENGTLGSKAFVNVDLEDTAFGSGFFYLVVFKTGTDNGTNDLYAVSRAVQYTTGESNAANGIYDINVDGAAPEMGQYIEISWMGGTWTTATTPEPTALALLALGVAGLALRRKI